MSLINDALKRAGEKPAPVPSASELTAGLHPAEERQTGFPVLTLLIVLIPLIALGVWFLAKGLQLSDQPKPASVETVAARVVEPRPAPVVIPTNSLPVGVAAPQPKQAYKLEGIYWRPSRPSAVINGKTVHVGDRVEKARVKGIDKESVTLAVDGEPKLLVLP